MIDKELEKVYPEFFRDGSCIGVYVPQGWNKLVTETLDSVRHIVRLTDGARFRIEQIKDKFGGLRLYYSYEGGTTHARNIVDGIVRLAEADSFQLCEECGAHARTRNSGGWLRTLCYTHYVDDCELRALEPEDEYPRERMSFEDIALAAKTIDSELKETYGSESYFMVGLSYCISITYETEDGAKCFRVIDDIGTLEDILNRTVGHCERVDEI